MMHTIKVWTCYYFFATLDHIYIPSFVGYERMLRWNRWVLAHQEANLPPSKMN